MGSPSSAPQGAGGDVAWLCSGVERETVMGMGLG